MITLALGDEPADDAEFAFWDALFDLAQRRTDWTLIGARMVQLYAASAGRAMLRTSRDGDVLADTRARPNAVRSIAKALIGEGFTLETPSAMGQGKLFVRDGVEIDLLAPEGLGTRSAAARVTVPGAHTVSVPGGTQALARSARVDVRARGRTGKIPIPNLLGAILVKCRAIDVDDRPDDQREDVALLLGLVADPAVLASGIKPAEKTWLRRHPELNDPTARHWRERPAEERQQGLAAYRQLVR